MGQRKKQGDRCPRCRQLRTLCLCSLIPTVLTQTEVVIVRHGHERHKTTNTGRLAALALERGHLHDFSSRTAPTEPPVRWDTQRPAALLYPREGGPAVEVGELRGLGPVTLFVVDGTWVQTRKMVRFVEPLPGLRAVRLPESARPRYVLRRDEHEGRMMTLDAIAQAIEILEGPEVAAPLHELYRHLIERTLASRGTPLPDGPTLAELLASSHPESRDGDGVVSRPAVINFPRGQGNQGLARRRTSVRRTSEPAD